MFREPKPIREGVPGARAAGLTILMLATLPTMWVGGSLCGQTSSQSESALVARIDSLSAILRRADSIADVADVVRREERRRSLEATIDTLMVGPFLVVAPEGEVDDAQRYFEQAWAPLAAIVGAEHTAIEGHVFIFGRGDALLGLRTQWSTRVGRRNPPRDIERMLGGLMAAAMPDDLQTWVGQFFIASDPTSELEWAYRSLVTTASSAVTDCYDGLLPRCWDALGLDHRDEWSTTWYTASEQRELVRNTGSTPGIEGVRAACLDAQMDNACVAALADGDTTAFIPLPAGTRMTLLAHALSMGGPEAYGRLVADTEAPIKDRLTQMSGVSADSLIGSWRAAILRARPDVHSDTRRSGWSSIMWLLLLAGVSTRSTRWRLT